MATGAGKTKVLSLLIAWSFFHKLYEPDSVLSRNFLVIAPNGCAGRNWRDDFQITLHIQDDVRVVRDTGGVVWIIETKGREELDLPQKMARLRQWCDDATAAEDNGQRYDFVFVDEISFEKHAPKTLAALAAGFTEYKS